MTYRTDNMMRKYVKDYGFMSLLKISDLNMVKKL